jgi:serine/threonine-protein kinase RsbW
MGERSFMRINIQDAASREGTSQLPTISDIPPYKVAFLCGAFGTRNALSEICAYLLAKGVPTDTISTVELVLAEVCNNITEHAYSDQPGWIELEVALKDGDLLCNSVDQGVSMPGCEPPNIPPPVPDPPDYLPEGGFGWHIIRCLTRELTYRRYEGENRLCFKIAA